MTATTEAAEQLVATRAFRTIAARLRVAKRLEENATGRAPRDRWAQLANCSAQALSDLAADAGIEVYPVAFTRSLPSVHHNDEQSTVNDPGHAALLRWVLEAGWKLWGEGSPTNPQEK